MIGIYKITSPTGRVYVGQSVKIKRRFKQYKGLHNCKQQTRLFNSLKKHGPEKHVFEVIELCDFDKLNDRERFWQEKLNVIGKLGLNCHLTNTNEKKKKVSDYTRAKFVLRCGDNHPSWGMKRTKEQRKRMSDAQKGKKRKPFSEKTKKKISDRMKGNDIWVGRKHNESTKIKMSKNSKNNRIILDLNTGVFYNSILDFCEINKLKVPTVYMQLSGKRKVNKFSNIIIT